MKPYYSLHDVFSATSIFSVSRTYKSESLLDLMKTADACAAQNPKGSYVILYLFEDNIGKYAKEVYRVTYDDLKERGQKFWLLSENNPRQFSHIKIYSSVDDAVNDKVKNSFTKLYLSHISKDIVGLRKEYDGTLKYLITPYEY